MKYGSLVLEKKDFVMIKRYQHLTHYVEDYAHKDALDNLKENMSNALIYDLEEMPDDIVRMYSYVSLSYESGWSETFQLVPPFEKDIDNDKISIQSRLGVSIIGLSEGDSLKFGLPGDIIALTIQKVKQSDQYLTVDISEKTFKNVLPKHSKNLISQNL